MINKLLLFVAAAALTIQPAHSQSRSADPMKEVKAGEVVRLDDTLTVKVTRSTKSPFARVKVKGEPVVVVLELDSGKKGATLFYNLSADPRSADIYLAGGAERHAPRAVIEDFPSWGGDNDREVEVLDPRETSNSVSLKFEGKGFVSLLFDVPAGQAATSRKLSIILRTGERKEQQHSFVVNM